MMFKKKIYLLVMGILILTTPAFADDISATKGSDVQISNQELLREMKGEMKAMEQRIQALESKLQEQGRSSRISSAAEASQPTAGTTPNNLPTPGNKNIFGLYNSPVEGLKLGAYGEFKVGSQQNKSDNGHWQNGFDAGRFVLLPSYQFTDNISLNSEVEFEHGGSGFDNDDKLHGTAQIEQAYIDFKVRDYLNLHSPGIDLVPIGFTNQHHEPTTFYSVNRPELANGLTPTTFFVPSWGTVYGKITNNIGYQFQLSSSIEDFGDSFDTRTSANSVPTGAYAAGIEGSDGLGFSKPPIGDFRQLNNKLAYATQLSYTPPFVPGLAGSSSVYFTPNVEPRGAHSNAGINLGASSLTLVDSELRYRVPKTGFELRGEYAEAFFGNPANLRANNDTDATNNVGSTMWGASGEVAYHILLGHALGCNWEAVPFYRYTYEDLQTGGFRGTDSNAPTGAGQKQFHTVGVAVFPTPKLVLKLNYQHVEDKEKDGAKSDSILGAIGFFF